MSTSSSTTDADLELSRAERWIAHHVLLVKAEEELADGGRISSWLVDLLEYVESEGATISSEDAWALRDVLVSYAKEGDTPECDHTHAVKIAARIDEVFGSPPSGVTLE